MEKASRIMDLTSVVLASSGGTSTQIVFAVDETSLDVNLKAKNIHEYLFTAYKYHNMNRLF